MDENEMRDLLSEVLEHNDEECGTESEVKDTSTFEDAGLLTKNKGLVVRMKDGSEFQITILQSKDGS